MLMTELLGILSALTSALLFGGGDFSGGFASRRDDQLQVLTLSGIPSIAIMATLALIRGESLPSWGSALWAAFAGISGAFGLTMLYRALSMGSTAIASPTASVVGAVLPVLFGAATEGLPGIQQCIGFLTAITGIWLVTKSPRSAKALSQKSLTLAILAGVGFSGFYILITRVESGAIFTPLIIARAAGACVALGLLLSRKMAVPAPHSNPAALLAGALDVSANAFYLVATQYVRLDIAVVLSSLSPAITVLLAYKLLKESVSQQQWAGVFLCLIAIAFIVI